MDLYYNLEVSAHKYTPYCPARKLWFMKMSESEILLLQIAQQNAQTLMFY